MRKGSSPAPKNLTIKWPESSQQRRTRTCRSFSSGRVVKPTANQGYHQGASVRVKQSQRTRMDPRVNTHVGRALVHVRGPHTRRCLQYADRACCHQHHAAWPRPVHFHMPSINIHRLSLLLLVATTTPPMSCGIGPRRAVASSSWGNNSRAVGASGCAARRTCRSRSRKQRHGRPSQGLGQPQETHHLAARGARGEPRGGVGGEDRRPRRLQCELVLHERHGCQQGCETKSLELNRT